MKKIIIVAFLMCSLVACGEKKSFTCETTNGDKLTLSAEKSNGPVTKIEATTTSTLAELGLSSAEEFELYKSLLIPLFSTGDSRTADMTLDGDKVTLSIITDTTKMTDEELADIGYEIISLKEAKAELEAEGMKCK